MPTRTCSLSPPDWQPPETGQAMTLHLRTITPLFGGGYEPREVDPLCIIRPAAIRGHLRFWWRATVGAKCESADALFEAEESLWGSAEKPGKVTLTIQIGDSGTCMKCAQFEWRHDRQRYGAFPRFVQGWPSYALQAFQGELKKDRQNIKTEPSEARVNTAFDLIVAVEGSASQTEVRRAVWAWVTFGGIGARTRRGCGSIACDEFLGLAAFDAGNAASAELPNLHGATVIQGSKTSDSIAAWRSAVEVYQQFRQGEDIARTHRKKKPAGADNRTPGRSWWPEPDSIRRITGRHAANHSPTHAVQRGFPRADLGLPIIFPFKDTGDPQDTTLHGPADRLDRFASPVITKAVAVNGGYRPLVLVLNAPHVWQFGNLRLNNTTEITEAEITLTPDERAQVPPLAGQDVREALIRHVENTWNTKREVLP